MNRHAPAGNRQIEEQSPARLAWWIRALAALPLPLLHAVGTFAGVLARVVVRFRLSTVRANLRRCFPTLSTAELRAIERRNYRAMSQTAVEFIKLAGMSEAELRQRVRLLNPELLTAERTAGHSVMLLCAHQGNWEWILQRMALECRPDFSAAYKPLRNTALDRQLWLLRSRFGAHMTPAKALLRVLIRRRSGSVTGLAADQMPLSSPTRVWLNFMGVPTAFYPGPAEIAARYDYAAFFVALRRTAPGQYEATFQPIAAAGEKLAVEEFTRRFAAGVEAMLRADPADWAWGHRRWKLEPPQQLPSQSSAAD
jgi:Kdo2-lipid IVA lauroyltransferase/acyltransferase